MPDFTGWTQTGGGLFQAAVDTTPTLPPGFYSTTLIQGALYFILDEESDRTVLRFPGSPTDAVVAELEDFWTKGAVFDKHGLPHKRGILLWGPPGSGKSCTIQLIARDVIERGGLVLEFSSSFLSAYRTLRAVEPERPIVVLMEDLDSVITPQNESGILNVLDGIGEMTKVAFIATTNYPEKLVDRIINRPSRFDRKVLIGHPSEPSRVVYLESLGLEGDEVDVQRWAKDTEGFSLAHLKEMFVAVVILGNSYAATLKQLRSMSERVDSFQGEGRDSGFGVYA